MTMPALEEVLSVIEHLVVYGAARNDAEREALLAKIRPEPAPEPAGEPVQEPVQTPVQTEGEFE